MALNDSTNTSVRWLTKALPDWNNDVALVQTWLTDVIIASKGAEQRARRRELPRYNLQYILAGQSTKEWSKRHMAAIRELGAPIGVPVWTHRFAFASETTGVVTLTTGGLALSKTPFQVGQYAFFLDRNQIYADVVRKITDIDDVAGTITVDDPIEPSGYQVPSWSSAWVYPCLVGMRNESSWSITRTRADLTDEFMDFIQL